MEKLPGTLWVNHGRWNWRVKLPGEKKRKNIPLRLPGQNLPIPEERGISLAESLAWKEWEKHSRQSSGQAHTNACITLEDAAARFMEWADKYYRHADGSQTRERGNCELALRRLRAKYRNEPIDNIGYTAILTERGELEASGLNRATINQRVGIWKRFISWALDNRLCSASTKSEWWAISNLKRNRTQAPEGKPVMPVSHATVKATLPYLPEYVRVMVSVHELCGARPGEICSMRPLDIEKRRNVWIYRPASHKTEYRDMVRVIVLGPRAQRLLAEHWRGSWTSAEPMFLPQRTPQSKRNNAPPWPVKNYSWAVRYAVEAANKNGENVPHWSPNQLRHACGTRVRRRFGVVSARAILGHSHGYKITDRYTRDAIEAEIIKLVTPPMLAMG